MAVLREGWSFDDVLLVPRKGILSERKFAKINSLVTTDHPITIPFLSAPMDSVTEANMANAMWDSGGRGVLHRFCTIEKQVGMYRQVRGATADCYCALGLHDGIERADKLSAEGCTLFILDIAHAHTESVLKWMKMWENIMPTNLNLVVGNIATADAAIELHMAGADGLKVGIGPGAACTTRMVTGFGVPQLTAIMDVRAVTSLPIIADGGIKNSGDAVKALAAGADTVMLGSLLAGADESPLPGHYWGMASKKINGHHAPEGVEGTVPLTGPVADTLSNLTWGLRSAISYAGAKDLASLREQAEFIRVSPLAQIETSTRF